jgi:hypothetical protein
MWQKAEAGESEFIAVFVPWYWQEEYVLPLPEGFLMTIEEERLAEQYNLTPEQIMWRRNKIVEFSVNGADGERSFMQEYPCCAAESFQLSGEDTFIDTELVMQARKSNYNDYVGPLLIGVDPARFGSDRTAIIRRRGRIAYKLETHVKKDTMEITGMVHRIIMEERPAKVFVDVGGLGAGIVDRLKELGHDSIVVGVNAGSSPLNQYKYNNKRAEMWAELKAWLMDGPVKIPDSDELHSDLCGVRYRIDSNSRLVMEKKEDMKKRGVRSSDCADSICLTFAQPVSAIINFTQSKQIAGTILRTQMAQIEARGIIYGSGE